MKCPKCGFENEHGVKFCGNCGRDMSKTAPAPPLPRKPSKAGWVWMVIALFIVLFVAAGAWYVSSRPASESADPVITAQPIQAVSSIPVMTLMPSETSAPEDQNVLLYDDFSNPASGWPVFGGPGERSEVGYQNGYYRMAFYQLTGFDAGWSLDEYEDFTIETVFSTPADAADVGAGFTLRTREKAWYLLWVYPAQGKYIFQKDINGKITELIPLKESPVIRPLEQADRLHLRLKVIVRGERFEIWIAQPESVYAYLDSVSDAELPVGHLGPSADCPDAAPDLPVEVLFDWIKISK